MRNHFLGVDGGGTQTTALVSDDAGRVIGRGRAGSSNLHAAGEAAALAALEDAIQQACALAAIQPRDVRVACLGLAGAARPDDQERLRAWATRTLPDVELRLVTDMALALAAGTPEGWGVAVIAGTGSAIGGRAPDGRLSRAGGWGWALGDEGSGFAVGLGALRAVVRAADGRGPQTALHEAVLAHWSLPDPSRLVATVYRTPFPRAEIAALTPLVEQAAAAGDTVARALLTEAGRELALGVATVIHGLALQAPVPLALAGGVLTRGRAVAEALLAHLSDSGVICAPVQRVLEPAQGALVLAQREMNA